MRRHASAVVPPWPSMISTSRSLPMISSGLCFFAGIRRPFLDPDCHSRWTTQKGAAHPCRRRHELPPQAFQSLCRDCYARIGSARYPRCRRGKTYTSNRHLRAHTILRAGRGGCTPRRRHALPQYSLYASEDRPLRSLHDLRSCRTFHRLFE